jgi:hypothetical protein
LSYLVRTAGVLAGCAAGNRRSRYQHHGATRSGAGQRHGSSHLGLLLVGALDLGLVVEDDLDAVLLLLGHLLVDKLDLRRARQAERLCKELDRQLGHLEDGLVLLDVDRLEVRDEGPLAEVLELGVLEGKRLELVADRLRLGRPDLDRLDALDALLLELGEHAGLLRGQDEQERLALGLVAGRPADAVDVRLAVLGHVELDDPVDRGEVEPAGGNVGRKQAAGRRRRKLLEDRQPLRLLLLAVQLEQGRAGMELAEGLVNEADLRAADGVSARSELGRRQSPARQRRRTCLHDDMKTMILLLRCVLMNEKRTSSLR